MSGFGEAHDVYVVFGHVAMDFVTFSLGVDALYVEGADLVRGFVFDGGEWSSGWFEFVWVVCIKGRNGFLSPVRGLVFTSAVGLAGVAATGGAVYFSLAYGCFATEAAFGVSVAWVFAGRVLVKRGLDSLVSAGGLGALGGAVVGRRRPRLTRHAVRQIATRALCR